MLLPGYGGASLAEVPRSLLAALGLREPNALALEQADRVCLFLVDGLGAELLRAHPEAAPFLTSGMTARTLTAGFPATTVTSLCTLGTGLTPGEHGMVGLMLAVPGTGHLLNCLRWTHPDGMTVDPDEWQPATTVYQRAAAAGVEPVYVGPAQFEGTGLTRAVYRGVRYVPADSVDDRVARVHEALRERRPAYVTVYYGDLDAAGHMTGWGSEEWLRQLALVDDMARRLAEGLPPGSALYVTADHGMVNATEKIDAESVPELTDGVALLGGEARARHVYARPGAAGQVLDAWRETLRGKAWVVSRQEAVESGWFGPHVRDAWLSRIGDVVAVPHTDLAITAPTRHRIEALFTGYHGSLTAAEQHVPLLEVRP
ncbi:Alkaline phosphodiesterase I / Nucleotide pyrophosphatase [[Actinomadura] parvosata subsp. kistnae]|uniref:Alkaline phosphatase family protein n=1 Tax=[Actinomadura] parvosata subsp. kistnae TaxID=1909395 RepID=A0A1V0AIA0_9ACTN|nr:nucleotide pyrophosphatase/phosphodiesterase family protein [Nonomuraea sp. ATCC 55076]AQZ69925.1 alkaline phosphatase family protein [Nonomuraea sp. ATCC 55076]SPL90250.1 Alkaline phosphodiesterase I / Nucleotide pyrophosphatase [Actinomadura parvosata subsp. kistnae]